MRRILSFLSIKPGKQPLDQLNRRLRNRYVSVLPHADRGARYPRSEEHTSELQSQSNLVCRLLLEKKNDLPTVRRIVQDLLVALHGGVEDDLAPRLPYP